MRTLLNTVSMLLAMLAACSTLLELMPPPGTHRSALLVLALVAGAAVVALWSSALLLHSVHVRLARGPGFVAWAQPSACTSWGSWLSHHWSFFSEGGRQEGLRLLGIEIAFSGRLNA